MTTLFDSGLTRCFLLLVMMKENNMAILFPLSLSCVDPLDYNLVHLASNLLAKWKKNKNNFKKTRQSVDHCSLSEMNFSFGGAPSKKVSLRVNAKSLTKEELLENARIEREKNARAKLEEKAALTLTTAIRKHLTRQRERNFQRNSFDETMLSKDNKSLEIVQNMMNKLLYFHSEGLSRNENQKMKIGC